MDLAQGRFRFMRNAFLMSTSLVIPAVLHAQVVPESPKSNTSVPEVSTQAAEANVQGAAPNPDTSGDIIVTAQKRSENLQRVPLSIQALNTATLTHNLVNGLNDYVKFLPSVAIKSTGPGFAQVYFRGVASGGDGNHSGPLPSVGTYLDEQPITTIQGALDIHVYDIARVEALAGPQGTLYGASSEAGTIRIITNKPDPSKFSASYNLEGTKVAHGGFGGKGEGYVNLPLSDHVAARIVGWYEHDGGYIDNVPGTRTFPTSGVTIDNKALVKKDFNDVDTYGARAQLGIDLDDSWTVTPSVMAQVQKTNGFFGYDPKVGDLKVVRFYPDKSDDKWYQAALTIHGKIADFDLTYTGSYLSRSVDVESDYSDYSFFYDQCCGYGTYVHDNAGNLINPSQHLKQNDRYSKTSQEIRVISPQSNRLRFIGGLFYQRQLHHIEQHYIIDDLADRDQVTGTTDNYFLTRQNRVDRDYAAFGQFDFDITKSLTLTAGGRLYRYDNTLIGFFGYGPTGGGGLGSSGELRCQAPAVLGGTPCTSLLLTDANLVAILRDGRALPARAKGNGFTHKLSLSYKVDSDHLLYATWSRGFRPGGINRVGTPYNADFLTNFEVGTKNTFLGRRLTANFTYYHEIWNDVQVARIGVNGITVIDNAGKAVIDGVEGDMRFRTDSGISLSGSAAYTNARLARVYDSGPNILAPKGQSLPITPKFKINATARYERPIGSSVAHIQATGAYQTGSFSDLRTIERGIKGRQPSYASVDLTSGVDRGNTSIELYLKNVFDKRGQISRFTACAEAVCGPTTYLSVIQPRTIGVRFGQKF